MKIKTTPTYLLQWMWVTVHIHWKRKCASLWLVYCSANQKKPCVLCFFSQGHRRKNWKVRKFILRDDPAYMHYYDPSKVGSQDCTTRKQTKIISVIGLLSCQICYLSVLSLLFCVPSLLVSGWWTSGLDPSPWVCDYSRGVCAWWWVRSSPPW